MHNVEVIALDGLTPTLRTAMSKLLDGLAEAVKEAQGKGVPVGLIVGQLEFYKAALIHQTFQSKE